MKLSARNQLKGTVTAVNKGAAIANVASITVEAVDDLGLTEGSEVTAIVKASDVIIATD